jgi:AcrR family transcriptional regulator
MTDDKPTWVRVLDAAVEIAAEEGIDVVSHRLVGTRAGLAPSNVAYYHPTAEHLRRAAALQITSRGMPEWGRVEFAVRRCLPDGHPERMPWPTDELSEWSPPDDDAVVADAVLWLYRHGTEATDADE